MQSVCIPNHIRISNVRTVIVAHTNYDIIAKIIALLSYSFIIFSIFILIYIHKAENYEISIYDVYPWYFWISIMLAIFLGQLILISGPLYSLRCLWCFGFLGVLIANALLLFLPLIRNYAAYGSGDVLTHIGYMRDILKTGYIGSDMYPMAHIMGVDIYMLTGIDLRGITMVYPQIFSFLFILFSLLLLDSIFYNKSQILCGLTFSSILLWSNANMSFAPNAQAFFIIPLVLYLFLKRYKPENRTKFMMLNILFLFLIIFYHPLVTLQLAILFLLMDCSYYLVRNHIYDASNLNFRSSIQMTFILLTTFFIWQSYAYLILNAFKRIYLWLYGEASQSNFVYYSTIVGRTNPPITYLIKQAFNVYGIYIITATIAIICIAIIFKKWMKRDKGLSVNQVYYALGFSIFFMLTILSFFSPTGFGFARTYWWSILFFLILVPSTVSFSPSFHKYDSLGLSSGRWSTILLTFCILLLVYASTSTLYLSPIIKMPGQHVTYAELNGMKFFFDKRNDDIYSLELGISQFRFYDELFGESFERKNIFFYDSPFFRENLYLLDHFGYSNNTLFGNNYKGPRYFLLSLLGRVSYPKMYPEFEDKWRYTEEDFNQLENDKSIIKLYSNRDLDIYFTYPISCKGG